MAETESVQKKGLGKIFQSTQALKAKATQVLPKPKPVEKVEQSTELPKKETQPKSKVSALLEAPGAIQAKITSALPKPKPAEKTEEVPTSNQTDSQPKGGISKLIQSTGELSAKVVDSLPKTNPLEAVNDLADKTIRRVGTPKQPKQPESLEEQRAKMDEIYKEERKQLRHQALYQWLSAIALTVSLVAKLLLDNS